MLLILQKQMEEARAAQAQADTRLQELTQQLEAERGAAATLQVGGSLMCLCITACLICTKTGRQVDSGQLAQTGSQANKP